MKYQSNRSVSLANRLRSMSSGSSSSIHGQLLFRWQLARHYHRMIRNLHLPSRSQPLKTRSNLHYCFQTNFPQTELLNRQTFRGYLSQKPTKIPLKSSDHQSPLRKQRAQLEPISSNGGRQISLFEGEILMKETFLIFSCWTKGHRT